MVNEIEELKNKVALLEKEIKDSENNTYKIREKLSKTRAKLQKAESDAIIEEAKLNDWKILVFTP